MKSPLINRVYAEINDRKVAEGGGIAIATIAGAVCWFIAFVVVFCPWRGE